MQFIGKSIATKCQGLPSEANFIGGLLCGKSLEEWISIKKNWLVGTDDGDDISRIFKPSPHLVLSPSPWGGETHREEASHIHGPLITAESDSASISADQSEERSAAKEKYDILEHGETKVPTSGSDFKSHQTVESYSGGAIHDVDERATETGAGGSEPLMKEESGSISDDKSEEQSASKAKHDILGDGERMMPISGSESKSESKEEIRVVDERATQEGEDNTTDEYVLKEKHYSVSVKEDQIEIKLDHQPILIEDVRSSIQPRSFPVTPVLNYIEKHLWELPEGPYGDSFVLFLQRNYHLTFIPTTFFDNMPNLRLLDLSDTRIRILPDSLFKLPKLKALMLSNCDGLGNISSDIGNLKQIEVLDLSGTTELNSLPEEIGQLVLLQHLKLSFYGPDNESEFGQLPSQLVSPSVLSKLKELQSLSITVHPDDHRWTDIASRILQEVSKLEMLSCLQLYFPKVEIFEEYSRTNPVWNKHALTMFNFVVGHNVKQVVSRVPEEVESLFNQQDKCLKLVNGDKVTQLIKTALIQVTAFYLDRHTGIRSLSEFGISNFKLLKFCVVRECPNIQVIMDGKAVEGAFPSLEYLGVFFLWELKHIWKKVPKTRVPSGNFEALKFLVVKTCPKIKFVFWESMLRCLSNLEELVVEDCEKVEKIVKEEKKKVKSDYVILPQLRKLVLQYLPELISLGNGLFVSEEKVNSHGCPKLVM